MEDSIDYRAMYETERARADGLAKRLTDTTTNAPNERILRTLLHDIRADVGNALSLSELVRMELAPTSDPNLYTLTNEGASFIPLISGCASRVLDMAQEYLDLSRMERGTYVLEPSGFNLIKAVHEAGIKVMHNAKKSVKLIYHAVDTHIAADFSNFIGEERKISSCVSNLVQNAYDAAPENTDVHIFLNSHKSNLTIEISNKGVIPKDLRDSEKLFAFGTTSGKKHGNGIGTYTARLFARVHGGDIDFQTNDAAQSTLFRISLPKQESDY